MCVFLQVCVRTCFGMCVRVSAPYIISYGDIMWSCVCMRLIAPAGFTAFVFTYVPLLRMCYC